ncbi:MAG: transglutaminase domain-containing protein, partial [Chromatiaceae bacterium]
MICPIFGARLGYQSDGRRLGRTLWRWALLCALGLAGSVGLAAEPPGSDTAANPISRDAVRERSEWLAERRRLLDRAQFDLQALHERLDYEPSAIIEFVTRQIAYEDYPGVLRGALGTLTSRSGNDLDQALLLATLLKDAGLDARIVAGTLPASQLDSKRLLLIERPARPGPFLQGPALAASDRKGSELIQALPRDGFRRFQSAHRADAAKGPDPEQTITAMTARLGRVLKAAGPLAPPWRPGTGMRDYHWVEYREGGSGPWQAVHPIFNDGAGPGTTPETVTYFGDSIPEALQQRIRVQAFIERSWGERLETVAVMPAWERPAASLASATLVYSNIPNGFLDPGTEDGEAALNAST